MKKYAKILLILLAIPLFCFKKCQDPESMLSKVAPNPFTDQTIIMYTLPQSGYVKISVFDNWGNLVKTLVDKTQDPGEYQTVFEADNLPTGMYHYVLQFDQYTESGKMVLVR